MPGRTPFAAVQDYLEPIKRCVAVLGHPTLIHGRDQKYTLNSVGYWRLGAEDGIQLRMKSAGTAAYFAAEQWYRIIEVDEERFPNANGKYRVTTLNYAYELRVDGLLEWQMHWHPQGDSYETRPHNHLASRPGAHLPTARHTIEDAVEWCVEYGAVPTCDDWLERITESNVVHEDNRTWSDKPT